MDALIKKKQKPIASRRLTLLISIADTHWTMVRIATAARYSLIACILALTFSRSIAVADVPPWLQLRVGTIAHLTNPLNLGRVRDGEVPGYLSLARLEGDGSGDHFDSRLRRGMMVTVEWISPTALADAPNWHAVRIRTASGWDGYIVGEPSLEPVPASGSILVTSSIGATPALFAGRSDTLGTPLDDGVRLQFIRYEPLRGEITWNVLVLSGALKGKSGFILPSSVTVGGRLPYFGSLDSR